MLFTEVIVKNFSSIARSLDAALAKSSGTLGGIGTLKKNKESRLLKDDADMFNELGEPRAGIVGFHLRNSDGSRQLSAGPFPTLLGTIARLILAA